MAVVAISLVAGCVGGIRTYTDSGRMISIGVNQEFVIVLGSNPTTGYGWQESHDQTMVELVESDYETGEGAEAGTVGAGGIEYFRFKALKAGETEITLVYKRPRGEEIAAQKVFTVSMRRY